MSPSVLTKIAIAGVAALSLGLPVNALAATHSTAHHPSAASHPGKKHPVKKHPGKKHPGKPAAARFTAVGVITAVDTATGVVSLDDKGGSPDLHGHAVTVTISSVTKITRDDASATLSQIQVGDDVTANGTRAAGGVLNAAHLNATSAPAPEPTATATATPTDTASPTATATASPTATDTATATPTDTASPTATATPAA